MTSQIPPGWTSTTIGEITAETLQRIPGPQEKFFYIDISSIDREKKCIVNPQLILGKDAPSRARKVVQTGDVLVSMTRPNLNAVALVPHNLDGQIASTGFEVLRTIKADSRWIFYLVRTLSFVERMSELVQGALYPAIRSKDARGFQIPLAPFREQKRIADKLDALLTRVDACRERLDRVPQILKRFRQSVLAAATSGKLTEDWREAKNIGLDSWISIRVGDKYKSFSGGTPARANSDFWNGPIGWLSSGDIKTRIITDSSETITERGLENSSAKIGAKGSVVVVVRSGILQHTLPVAILANSFAINQDIKCFDSGDIRLNQWLALYWQARQREILAENREGTTVQSVKYETLKNWILKVPFDGEQQEIIRRLELLFAYADRLEARYHAACERIERLTPALLAKAFRGELVLQNPDDEPASAVLERINARCGKSEGRKFNPRQCRGR